MNTNQKIRDTQGVSRIFWLFYRWARRLGGGDGSDEFQRMLRDAENGRFDCLLVWEIDRFGRERQDIPTGKMTLKRAGVKPHIDLLQYQRKRTALACSSAVQMSCCTTVDF